MTRLFLFVAIVFLTTMAGPWAGQRSAQAQSLRGVWVQIEAQPDLKTAVGRAADYAQTLPDVAGFSLGNGWFGIALGPYSAADAETVLQSYRRQGDIPRDSYIVFGAAFERQFWPQGVDLFDIGTLDLPAPPAAAPQAPSDAAQAAAPTLAPQPAPETQNPQPATTGHDPAQEDRETPAMARNSEAALSAAQKMALQRALQWAGVYASAIDGAFGRGTRAAMADWQAAQGFDVTGILTTHQRALLMQDYNAVLSGLDVAVVRDTAAGIELALPTAVLKFDRYAPPLAHYTGDTPDRMAFLISQSGDRASLTSLYETLQTLAVVPLDGARAIDGTSFRITGQNSRITTQIQATLTDGQIKGFALIWPTNDPTRRARLWSEMQRSFRSIGPALDPALAAGSAPNIDLISGLDIRRPKRSLSGFYVDGRGTALTLASGVEGCTRITLDDNAQARILWQDRRDDIAVLAPQDDLAPLDHARFSKVLPGIRAPIAYGGFSYGGALDGPSVTFGTLEDVKDLDGTPGQLRLGAQATPQDVGGPVLDPAGQVIAMLLPRPVGGAQLPPQVQFARPADRLISSLALSGVAAQTTGASAAAAPLPPEDITRRAAQITALVQCWD